MTKVQGPCSISGCARSAARSDGGRSGLCSIHYRHRTREAICSVGGCTRGAVAKTLCGMHYKRLKATGDPVSTLKVGRKPNTLADVDRMFTEQSRDECWPWIGTLTVERYGQFTMEQRTFIAHRFVYELRVGPIPASFTLDHVCHNEAAARGECAGGRACPHRRCVNPDHLVPKPSAENTLASPLTTGAVNAAKTHCPRGHPLSGDNLYLRPDKRRVCRVCKTEAQWRRRGTK